MAKLPEPPSVAEVSALGPEIIAFPAGTAVARISFGAAIFQFAGMNSVTGSRVAAVSTTVSPMQTVSRSPKREASSMPPGKADCRRSRFVRPESIVAGH